MTNTGTTTHNHTNIIEAGALRVGNIIIDRDGFPFMVERIASYMGGTRYPVEVEVWNGGERYLFAPREAVTVSWITDLCGIA